MQTVPLQPTPNQSLSIVLSNQSVTLNVYQKLTGMFMDVYVAGVLIIGGVLCRNLNRIVRDQYFGFQGDLLFLDNIGDTAPYYTGLGGRYSLIYLQPTDFSYVD